MKTTLRKPLSAAVGRGRLGTPVFALGLLALVAVPGPTAAIAGALPAGGWGEVVRVLASPWLAPVLLAVGFLGILVEIKHPTLGVAAGLGVVALALFFGSHYLVDLAGTTDLLLVGVGIALIGVEVFVVPGLGVPGFAGLAALLVGIFLSLVGPSPTRTDMIHASAILALALLLFLALAYGLVRHIPYSRALGGGDAATRDAGFLASAPRLDLVGHVGTAVTDLRPSGTAEFGDERIDVVTEGDWIERGTPVVVVRAEGYRHVVRAAASEPAR